MGALTHATAMLQELPPEDEMVFVGGPRGQSSANDGWRRFLEANPDEAHEIGRIVEGTVRSLQEAFPGEVRERTFSNDEWREAGYTDVADVNALLGLMGR